MENNVNEISKSKKQQKFFGLVKSVQDKKTDVKDVSDKVKKTAKNMSKKDVEDFASTKHKNIPEKVKKITKEEIIKMVKEEYNNLEEVDLSTDSKEKLDLIDDKIKQLEKEKLELKKGTLEVEKSKKDSDLFSRLGKIFEPGNKLEEEKKEEDTKEEAPKEVSKISKGKAEKIKNFVKKSKEENNVEKIFKLIKYLEKSLKKEFKEDEKK